jgi:uncharacterized membrane protein
MYKTTLARHPLHPILIVGPAGLLPFSLAMDMLHRSTGEQSYNHAAYHAMSAGVTTALAAGAAGAVDYLSIPEHSPTKRTGTIHGLMNIALVAIYGLNLRMRHKEERPSGVCVALSAIGTVGLLASAWFGGHMVYDQGMRVKGRSEIEHAPDLKIPGDDAIAEALERIGT